ncbi:MAG TPA: nitrilase-related carbon-nitrogen hydrolase [Thermoanaerobaculia bacterium]|nr:nitrilase-related carbon-nitrogen hydrolase [Thermoanaerobaculia bacterium]
MVFLSTAIDLIRKRAGVAKDWDDLRFIDLAAHLFAIGSQLLLNEGSARLMARLDKQTDLQATAYSLQELRVQLLALPDEITARDLYRTILVALVTIETILADTPSYPTALSPWTDLESFTDHRFRGIGGRVYHWFRPPSALAEIRSLRFEHVRSRPPEPSPHPGIYLDRLALYWDSDPQLPRMSLVIPSELPGGARIGRFVRTSGEDASLKRRFRIALCPLEGPFHPCFSIEPEGRYFQALRENAVRGADALAQHLGTVIEAADKEEARLVMFPELTIDSRAREHLRRELDRRSGREGALFGVVAGSFHFWHDSPQNPEDDPPVNETVLLDRAGTQVMSHRKKGRFRVPGTHATGPFFAEKPKEVSREVFEDIRYGSELQIFDTSLGRLALLICADAIAADDRGYLPLIRRLRPDLLLVVSMTPETEPFDAFAEEMSRHWIGTIFVNAHCICRSGGTHSRVLARLWGRLFALLRRKERPKVNLVAWDLALFETDRSAPTRVRWRSGSPEPECFYFKPESGPKGWRPLSKAPGRTGVSIFRQGGQTLGLLLDLGVHWEPAP